MKAVLLCGIPGTGKTHLTRQLMKDMNMTFFKEGLVIGHSNDEFTVFGDYRDENEVFAGTDKMSMAVSPEFQKYITKNTPDFFMEGDRLVGNKTIDFLINLGYDLKVIVLKVENDILQSRYKERGSNQDEKFLKSKATKVSNIETRIDLIMEDAILDRSHKNFDDTKSLVCEIKEILGVK